MRTTAEENVRMAEWIAARLNRMEGPVRLLLPEGGVSALDVPGQPFHDPAADKALFDTLTARVNTTPSRQRDPLAACDQRSAVRRRRWSRRSARSRVRRNAHAALPAPRSAGEVPGHGAARRADHRRRRRHRPVGEMRGSRRDRPDHPVQLRPLPHGRPRFARRTAGLRQRQRHRAGNGARGAAGGPAHTGDRRRERHRSVPADRGLLHPS